MRTSSRFNFHVSSLGESRVLQRGCVASDDRRVNFFLKALGGKNIWCFLLGQTENGGSLRNRHEGNSSSNLEYLNKELRSPFLLSEDGDVLRSSCRGDFFNNLL